MLYMFAQLYQSRALLAQRLSQPQKDIVVAVFRQMTELTAAAHVARAALHQQPPPVAQTATAPSTTFWPSEQQQDSSARQPVRTTDSPIVQQHVAAVPDEYKSLWAAAAAGVDATTGSAPVRYAS
jgi:hypothetical protein